MKYTKVAMASLLAAVFSMQILFSGCSSEPEKTEIDRTRSTKPKMVEEDGEDAEMPTMKKASSASFE